MKDNIHPAYREITISCMCGNKFTTRSTSERKELNIEVCSMCHPFYTGKQKLADSGGRVDKFRQRYTQKPQEVTSKEASPAKIEKINKKTKAKTKTTISRKIKVAAKPKVKKEAKAASKTTPKADTKHSVAAKTTKVEVKPTKKSTTTKHPRKKSDD